MTEVPLKKNIRSNFDDLIKGTPVEISTSSCYDSETSLPSDTEELGAKISQLDLSLEKQSLMIHNNSSSDLNHDKISDVDLVDVYANRTELGQITTLEAVAVLYDLLVKLSVPCGAPSNDPVFSKFQMKGAANIDLASYLERINMKCLLSQSIYLMAAHLIFTLHDKHGMCVSESNVHRLVMASIMVSFKLLEDEVYSHEYFSKVGGLSVKVLYKLERALLTCLQFDDLHVTDLTLLRIFEVAKNRH